MTGHRGLQLEVAEGDESRIHHKSGRLAVEHLVISSGTP